MEIQQLTQKIEEMNEHMNRLMEQQEESSSKQHHLLQQLTIRNSLQPNRRGDENNNKENPSTTAINSLSSSHSATLLMDLMKNSTLIQQIVLDPLKLKCMNDMKFHKKRSIDSSSFIDYISVGVMSSIQPRYMNLTLSMLRMGWLLNFEHKRVFVLDPIPKRKELETNSAYESVFWKKKQFFIDGYEMTSEEIDQHLKKKKNNEETLYLDQHSLDLVQNYFVNIFEHVDPNFISMKADSSFDGWSDEWKRSQSAFIYALKYVVERFSSPWYFVVDTDSYVDSHCLGNFFQYYGQWTYFCPLALGDSKQGFMGGPGLMFNHRVKDILQKHIKECVENTKKGGSWDIGLNGGL